jgi:hypothetical protein
VKSDPGNLRFNETWCGNADNLEKMLLWAGVFAGEKARSVAQRLLPLLHDGTNVDVAREGIVEGRCRVRPLLCCPPCTENHSGDRWCLVGSEIFSFIGQRLNPDQRRDECSTRYNFQQWGYALSPLIKYFKNQHAVPSDLAGLYTYMGAK